MSGCEIRGQEILKLKNDKVKLEKHRDFQIRRVEDEERSRKAIENDFNALQHAVLEVVTDKEIISINVRFDIILGKYSGCALLNRPSQSVLEANETNQSCQPTEEQEEPSEVIDLDDDVVYNLKRVVEMKTNG